MSFSSNFLVLLLAFLPTACGGGGGGGGGGASSVSVNSWNGTWSVVGVQTSTTCNPDPQLGTETATYSITINGSTATLDNGFFTVNLAVVNGRLVGSSAANSTNYDLGLTNNNTFVGTQTAGLAGNCSATFAVTGTRTASNPTPSIAQWNGSWDVVAVQTSTTCSPDPQFGTQTATYTITINGSTATLDFGVFAIEVPVVNGRLVGSSAFNLTDYDLGLTSNDTFVGTQVSGLGGGCTVTFAVTATRAASNPTPSIAQWNGSWDVVAVQTSTTCSPDPQFGTQTATYTITINGSTATLDFDVFAIEVPVVNGRIEGFSAFNLTDYDLGLTSNDTFVGTQVSGLGGGCTVTFAVTGSRVGS